MAVHLSTLSEYWGPPLLDGSFNFTLSDLDKIKYFPILNELTHQNTIINRTVEFSQQKIIFDANHVDYILTYIEKVGSGSDEGLRIVKMLENTEINYDGLKLVEKKFPSLADRKRDHMTVKLFLDIEGTDKILSHDLSKLINERIRGVKWETEFSPEIDLLKIEQVRLNERIIPDSKTTVSYSKYDVDIVSGALFMPQGSSYLFDKITGGYEIEYGFSIELTSGGDISYEDIVRGRVSSEYTKCENARIMNAFGGVTPAAFIASNMQASCKGPKNVSSEELLKDVLDNVVNGILEIPAISRVHRLN